MNKINKSSANIPFLETRVNYATALILLSSSALFTYTLLEIGFTWVALGLLLPLPLTALEIWITSKRNLEIFNRMEEVLRCANRGELYHRITGTRGLGELGRVAWELNETLDLLESYFKEVNTCFHHASLGNYERYALSDGFPGLLKRSAKDMNTALKHMNENEKLTIKRRLSAGLHTLNTSNLLANLKSNQDDVLNITNQLQKVEDITNETGQNAEASLSTVETISSSLTTCSAARYLAELCAIFGVKFTTKLTQKPPNSY